MLKQALIFLSLSVSLFLQAQTIPQHVLTGIQARSIGPAGMSGRITCIDVVLNKPDIWYIGTASGGLWVTKNGGITFDPIFDKQSVLSIGAVAIAQSNPNIIYAGTGEGNPRNTVSSGAGIFKSEDGGTNWTFLGLKNSKNIHRIIVHPTNPDIVWVGVIGPPFGPTAERGLFKTIDGGANWKKVLFTNNRSGIADLVIHPTNPNLLFAAMWEHRRTPWDFLSGGAGSGLFTSKDAGETWQELTTRNGLPEKPYGRIGLAIAPSNPTIMYALIESEKNALFKSENGGQNWQRINEKTIGSRPFYFAEMKVDPKEESRIYNLYSRLALSVNGGKDFKVIEDWGREVHADHHAMWIHPDNPNFIILGTDGGLYWTKDKTENWNFADDLPIAQFYHVAVDMETPYNIYGGLQDNGTWYGPAYTWHRAGLRNQYWKELAFNDGFDVVLEKSDENIAYALWQGGMLVRINKETGQRKTIKPIAQDIPLRFNWNAAIAKDPFQNNTIYIGSQFVHKSSNRGDSWKIISPDLTTNNPLKQKQYESGGLSIDATDAENHTTITAISPSPLKKDLLWVGTDDGLVQLSKNGGETWENVTPTFKDLPPNSWISQIQPSVYDEKIAFVVIDNHRRDDWKPYVYQTKNQGKSWELITDTTQINGYALSFLQDPEAPNLYFLGTEFGLYYSFNAGKDWRLWTNGLPNASITDMVLHPREHDLVLATFGRSFYVLDDIRPLRKLANNQQTVLNKSLHLFDIPDATLGIIQQAHGQRLSPDRIFKGKNRPYGAIISFWKQAESPIDSVDLVILKNTAIIYQSKLKTQSGLNRFHWNLQMDGKAIYGPLMDPNLEKPWVIPGTYQIQIKDSLTTIEKTLQVLPDPKVNYHPEKSAVALALRNRLEKLAAEKDGLQKILQAELISLEQIDKRDVLPYVLKIKNYQQLLDLIIPNVKQGVISSSTHIGPRIDKAFYYMHSPYEGVSENDLALVEQLEEEWAVVAEKINDSLQKERW